MPTHVVYSESAPLPPVLSRCRGCSPERKRDLIQKIVALMGASPGYHTHLFFKFQSITVPRTGAESHAYASMTYPTTPRLVAAECPTSSPRRRRDSSPRNVRRRRRGVAATCPRRRGSSPRAPRNLDDAADSIAQVPNMRTLLDAFPETPWIFVYRDRADILPVGTDFCDVRKEDATSSPTLQE